MIALSGELGAAGTGVLPLPRANGETRPAAPEPGADVEDIADGLAALAELLADRLSRHHGRGNHAG